jgi:hypothetical protein
MTNDELINRTMELILSGGRRTTAANVRALLNDIFPSYFNLENGGNVVKVLSGYETQLTPTDPKHFATKKYVDDNSGQTNWGDIQGYIEMQGDLINYIAAEIAAIPSPDLTALWNLSGNTFDARKKLGSTSGDFGFDIYKDNVVQGGLSDTAKWYWGTNAAFTDTDHSFRGAGNTSASYALQVQNSDNSASAWFRNDGVFNSNEYFIGGSSFARYSNGSAIIQMTPETPDKLGVGTDWLAIGRFAMFNATNPTGIVAIGGNSFVNATDFSNSVGIGVGSGRNNITGSRLMYIGQDAGYYNETGDDQIMIGRLATPAVGATALNSVIVIASGGVVRQSYTGVFGSNDSPISRYVFGRGESETTTFEDVYFTAHYPANNSNQNAGGSLGFAPPQARGTGVAGDLKFYYSPTVGSGTNLQSLVEAMKIIGETGAIEIPLVDYASNAAAVAAGLSVNQLYRTGGDVKIVI